MKGIIHKEDYGWVVRYKLREENSPWYELPISPYEITNNYQTRILLIEGNEVEFEIEKVWETGFEKEVEWATIIKSGKDIWNEILIQFYDNYNVNNGKDWDKFLEWLKDNYYEPVKKQRS